MPEPTGTRSLVVIVDDDSSLRRALRRGLRGEGYDVEVLASAGELLAFRWPAQPTCLVVDVHLPDLSGLELLRRIAARDPPVPVVVVTGDPDPKLEEQALRYGAAAFLRKPFDGERLLAEIHRALGL